MKHKKKSVIPARFPLTIGTPYGVVSLELEVCPDCGEHFNYRFTDVPPLLCTRQAEPFLYRLSHTLESVANDMWLDLPPQSVKNEIDLNIYRPGQVVLPKDVN